MVSDRVVSCADHDFTNPGIRTLTRDGIGYVITSSDNYGFAFEANDDAFSVDNELPDFTWREPVFPDFDDLGTLSVAATHDRGPAEAESVPDGTFLAKRSDAGWSVEETPLDSVVRFEWTAAGPRIWTWSGGDNYSLATRSNDSWAEESITVSNETYGIIEFETLADGSVLQFEYLAEGDGYQLVATGDESSVAIGPIFSYDPPEFRIATAPDGLATPHPWASLTTIDGELAIVLPDGTELPLTGLFADRLTSESDCGSSGLSEDECGAKGECTATSEGILEGDWGIEWISEDEVVVVALDSSITSTFTYSYNDLEDRGEDCDASLIDQSNTGRLLAERIDVTTGDRSPMFDLPAGTQAQSGVFYSSGGSLRGLDLAVDGDDLFVGVAFRPEGASVIERDLRVMQIDLGAQ